MTNDEQPEPVAILIRPRFDEEGKPTCRGCPLEVDNWDDVYLCYRYTCREEWGSYVLPNPRIPAPDCPIHNPEAREGMEAL